MPEDDPRDVDPVDDAKEKATLAAPGSASDPGTAATVREIPVAVVPNAALISTMAQPDTTRSGGWDEDAEVTDECRGRYTIPNMGGATAEIGRGGIGRVLIVRDHHLGRDIALKELLPSVIAASSMAGASAGTLPAAAIRFLREARVTGQLEHPNIVPVYELGRRRDGTLYYTMKLVRGRTMAKALREASSLPDRLKLLSHFADLCNAIAYAHSRGVIHRDIKTANVMLGEFGETVVLDWGLAKVVSSSEVQVDSIGGDAQLREAREGLTVAGSLMGTPAYMSPEQASGNADLIDERSDVWALGIVLYEILTGDTPFHGTSIAEIARKVRTEPARPPREIDERIPADLASVAMKALARDPGDRYPSARKLASEIESYQSGARVLAHEYTSWEHFKRFASKNKPALVAAVLTLVAILAALVVATTFYAREKSAREQAQNATRREASALQQEHRERTLASYHIAQGVYEKAQRASIIAAWPAARVHAAASLVHNPACPRSPAFTEEFAALHPESQRLYLSALSRFYQASASSLLAYQRTLRDDHKLTSVAFSPDGRHVAAIGAGKQVRVWDVRTSQPTLTLDGHKTPGTSVAFSPDGNRLASCSQDGELRIWNAHSGSLVTSIQAHGEAVDDLAFSADGKWIVTASQDRTAAIWDASSLRKSGLLEGHDGQLHGVAISRSGALIATASRDKTIRVWDAATRTTLRTLRGHTGVVRGVAFSPDSTRLASASYDKTIRVWDVATGRALWTGEGFDDEALAVAFSPNGDRIASASWDRSVRIWDADSGLLLTRVEGHDAAAWHVAFSPDGATLASVGEDRRVRLWSVLPGHGVLASQSQGYLWATRYSPDGRTIATGGADGKVRLWDVASRKVRATLVGHSDLVADIAWSSEGSMIASAGYDRSARLWDASTGRELRTMTGHDGFVRGVALSPDRSTLATASHDQTVGVWEVATGRLRHRLSGHAGPVRGVAFSPDGKVIASAGNDSTVRVWDAASGAPVATWTGDRDAMVGIRFASDGKSAISAGFDGKAIVWDAATGSRKSVLSWHRQGIYNAPVSPDDKLVATASDDRSVAVWILGQAQPALVIEATQSVVAVDFSPDGKTLVLGDGAAARLMPVDLSIRGQQADQLQRDAERETGMKLDGFSLTLVE